MQILDIGGGFPAPYIRPVDSLADFCAPVGRALDELFPHGSGVTIMSEPGRGVSGPAMVSISHVLGVSERGGKPWYYLDDGVYGAYSGVICEHGEYPIVSLKELEQPNITLIDSVLAGPTCDSIDVIADAIPLPALEVGDVIIGINMGAYSVATTTDFNMFPRAKIILT